MVGFIEVSRVKDTLKFLTFVLLQRQKQEINLGL
jgi:hypothetical protein